MFSTPLVPPRDTTDTDCMDACACDSGRCWPPHMDCDISMEAVEATASGFASIAAPRCSPGSCGSPALLLCLFLRRERRDRRR